MTLPLTVNVFERDFVTPVAMHHLALRPIRYSCNTDVGMEYAVLRAYPLGDMHDLRQLQRWLRYYVVIGTAAETPLWGGIIRRVRIHRGGLVDHVFDLDGMANRINVLYNRRVSAVAVRGQAASTGWDSDVDSVSEYGRFELYHRESGDTTDATALTLRGALLNERARPRRSIEQGFAGQPPAGNAVGSADSALRTDVYAEIECIGVTQALQYVYPSANPLVGVIENWPASIELQWLGRVMVGENRFIVTAATPGVIEDMNSRYAFREWEWFTLQGGNIINGTYQATNNRGGRYIDANPVVIFAAPSIWRMAIIPFAWKLAQRVTLPNSRIINAINIWAGRVDAHDGLMLSFCADAGGVPGAAILTANRYDIGGQPAEQIFEFLPTAVGAGVYWIVLERTDQAVNDYYPDNYYNIGIDPLAGYGGNLWMWNPDGGVQPPSIINPMLGFWQPLPERANPAVNLFDLVFRISGVVDVADMTANVLATNTQFILGVEQAVVAGNFVVPYLDPERRVLDELMRIMRFGTAGFAPLEIRLGTDRRVVVRARPPYTIDDLHWMDSSGKLYNSAGVEIPPAYATCGVWVRDLNDIANVSDAELGIDDAYYVRAAEYDAESNTCQYILARQLSPGEWLSINPQVSELLLPGIRPVL